MEDKSIQNFVHLHVHTAYSLLDGSGKIDKLIERAKELGMKSLAITDHGSMYGCVEFYKEAKKQGIKPIIGCEIYVSEKEMDLRDISQNKIYHLVLLVKNKTGYENLMKIVSKASIDGFYYKPRVDHEYLKSHSEGLIASSACLGGEVASNILNGNLEKAKKAALFYKDTFKDGFYLEIQDHEVEEQLKVNDKLIKLSKELDIPLIATNDVHYIKKEDYKAHDVLLCIQTGKTVNDENRMRYPEGQFYLKSAEEMSDKFSYVPEALKNTAKIADECNFDYEFHVSKLPDFPLDCGIDHYEYLRKLCLDGLKEKYSKVTDNLMNRLNYELNIIKQMGYVDYFLIVWDFIRFARENKIMTGPGRGSAAGSIVAYILGITKIDPIKYNLIFERFLNPERVSMPDIDSDFCYERRQEVIDYVVKKYGKDNVSQIITFGTMAARACIRDVGRALDYSYAEVDKIAKMIPFAPGKSITIDKAIELNPELKNEYENNSKVAELIDVSKSLEGLPRHTSTHAAGVVISSKPLVNYVPLQKNEESIVSQFTMGTLEELGLLKMDFLGLRTLTVIKDAVDIINQNKNINLDIDKFNFEDKNVYNMIGEGKTTGVFQLESPGMVNFMKELKPTSLEDIIAGISLYRPGPMSEIPNYLKNKQNPSQIKYITPELESILNVTYGCIIYQEQVMEIFRKLAGYSMGRSDLVRRAMSKKKHDVMLEEKKNFIYGIVDEDGKVIVPGCIRNGITKEAATEIFNLMIDFASYAFNKSHAASYAVVAYQTAYLMCYYPVEFTAALLNSVKGDNDKVAYYIRFAKRLDIDVLPPDINESYSNFTVDGNKIRFGMSAIKNVGINVVESIIKTRNEVGKFKDFMDFCNKVDSSVVNKRTVESLIKCGAFDCFSIYRSKLLAVYEKVLSGVSNNQKKNIKGQISLFDVLGEEDTSLNIVYPNIKEFDKKYILAMEKEMTGVYISGHPLNEYKHSLEILTKNKTTDIIVNDDIENSSIDINVNKNSLNIKDGDKVTVGGILTNVKTKVTRNKNMMAFVNLEDLYGNIEVIIFPKIMEKYNRLINEDELVIINGTVSIKEDEQTKILCNSIQKLYNVDLPKIYIQIENKQKIDETVNIIKKLSSEYSGNTPIYICTKDERKKYVVESSNWLNDEPEVMSNLMNIFQDENVKKI